MFIVDLLPHGHQMSHVPNSSHLIEPHNSHRPFASSCITTNLFSTSSQIQTTNHPLITLLILTNHTPPTSALLVPNPSCEWKVTTLHFPKPLRSCITKTFSPSHSIGPYNWPWSYPPTYPHFFNMPLTFT